LNILIELFTCPSVTESSVEVVERKGLGHPDTICDLLSEELSRALASYYLDNFGCVLHHNVDKSLLVGGCSAPAFAGGRVLQPMDLFLSGRATTNVHGKQVLVAEITHNAVEGWLRRNLHAVDPTSHIRVHDLVQPGSPDLVDLFERRRNHQFPLANDTSCGTGFTPLTELERAHGTQVSLWSWLPRWPCRTPASPWRGGGRRRFSPHRACGRSRPGSTVHS
jgi:S-adenosylmethionine synthetase